MAVAQKLAGYTLGQADLLRRAMGKKKKEVLDAEYVPFSDGMKANGYSAGGDQGAVGRPGPVLRLRVQQGAHRGVRPDLLLDRLPQGSTTPAEYMAALLTSVKDDKDKMAIYLNECRRMKIQVLPPDVNESAANFTPVGNDIRFGLTAIRNVGGNVVDGIVSAPRGEGPLRRLQRLHGEGPRAGLQQAGHRVAGQGRRLRRDEAPAPGAGRDPRDGRRPVRRHQAQRGDRPGLAVRRPRRRGRGPASGSR